MTTKITSANIAQSGTSGISSVSWQSVQTTGFTAVAGNAYPCNTTSAAFTVTLPASPAAGNVITLTDYAGTWGTNNLTINPNGNKLNGGTSNATLSTNRGSAQIVYVDSTQGWIAYSGFAVTTIPQVLIVDYLVVAGGGGGNSTAGGLRTSGGGGGGGLLSGQFTPTLGTSYGVTVGGGGGSNSNGNPSVFHAFTALGGGRGSAQPNAAGNGGSGGGGWHDSSLPGGDGTAGQGYDGGDGYSSGNATLNFGGGGGGGAGGLGGTAQSSASGAAGAGGVGAISTIITTAQATTLGLGQVVGSDVYFAGGGGGGAQANSGTPNYAGGAASNGGGGAGGKNTAGSNGTANTGGGGGGSGNNGGGTSGGGGCVIIRYPDSFSAATSTTGTPTITVSGGYRIYSWTGNGTIAF